MDLARTGLTNGTGSALEDVGSQPGRHGELLRRSVPEVPSDAALLARARGENREALGELYDRHAAPAYSLAARLVGATAAADVVHDAFVALLEKPATFDPTMGTFRSWFMAAIHHRCLNLLRHERPAVGEESLSEMPGQDPEPVDDIVRRLQDASVRDALSVLPIEQREALVLAYYEGLSQSAIAERVGAPLGTVKARMRRGLMSLRGLLRGEAARIDEEATE